MGAVRNLDFHINFLPKIIKYIVCINLLSSNRFIGHLFNQLEIRMAKPQVWQQRGVGVGPTRLGALDRGIGQGIGSTFQRGFIGQRHGVEKFQGRKWLIKPY